MAWDYEFHELARRQLEKIGPADAAKIKAWLDKRVLGATDPRLFGKPLRGKLHGLWRYRVEDYRLLCRLEDRRLMVLIVEIGHRSTVYED